MADSDSLVATRARRVNAGSRLKQLIEREEQATGISNVVYSEEDENVHLLFQEDENDEEFENSEGGVSDSDEADGNESVNEETESIAAEKSERGVSPSDEKATDAEVNSDEMLSESDLSASENDDSEGERELQSTERQKKRKTKASALIPAIKKPKLFTEKAKPKVRAKHSELLLDIDRRASSRKSAMKNKEILVQKLKEDETRRAALAPVVRVDEVQLTQEERLAQAVETEKANVLSLHSFLEQEIVKKEHQKLLFQQRRPKLRNVIRLLSRKTFVSPFDEIEDARHAQDLFDKKRKGRRRKTTSDHPEEPRPGDIDTELPYYKKEMEEKRIRDEKEAAEKERIEKEREEKRRRIAEQEEKRIRELEEERDTRKAAKEERFKEFENVSITDHASKDSFVTESKEREGNTEGVTHESELHASEVMPEHIEVRSGLPLTTGSDEAAKELDGVLSTPIQIHEDEEPELELEISEKVETSNSPSNTETFDDRENPKDSIEDGTDIESIKPSIESAEGSSEKEQDSLIDLHAAETEDLPGGQHSSEKMNIDEKKVSFAVSEGDEQVPDHHNDSEFMESNELYDTKILYRADKDGHVYEGPVQLVGRNDIILINFDEDHYPYLSEKKIKAAIFGEDANLGASRRFRDGKTVLKSSIRSDNPYAAPKEERENELLAPVTEITEESAMFEVLKRLPRLGVKEFFEEEEADVQNEETAEIQIRTEAPSGLYLPNGNKKLCLISGKEARYFDPATGLPYENKEVYKIIKTIEQGLIPWYSIGKDQNTYGDIQIYLNHRNGSRHAKGVPEGFDGC
ncbi:hypothetical protein OXX69_000870 [Metschnikowia pulcherrima]